MIRDFFLYLKLKVKSIVINSDLLSSVRRFYRYNKAKIIYKKMKQSYDLSGQSERIKSFRNTHVGERCFIIGNGPSLKPEDLERIKNEYSFATNRIYLIYDKTKWRPSFYMCQDRQLLRAVSDYYKTCHETVFLGYPALYEYNIYVPTAYYYLADNRDANRIVEELFFSENADKFVVDGGSVTYSAIQMAVYMGFREIYLLGVDHNFSHTLDKNRKVIEHKDVKEDYFDNRYMNAFKQFEEKGKTYAAPDKELIDLAFEAAFDYSKTHDIRIFNATRGGKLEIFPRVDFDKLMEAKK